MRSAIAAHGISIVAPSKWDARIFRRTRGGGATLHLANFALPHTDGEFGTRATSTMDPDGLFLALTEYVPDEHLTPGRGLFASSRPQALLPGDFDHRALLHMRQGQVGAQRFFTAADRAFCLYIVIGSERHLTGQARIATVIIRSLRVTAEPVN